jgi:hypothetical protein
MSTLPPVAPVTPVTPVTPESPAARLDLTSAEAEQQAAFQAFVDAEIAPHAEDIDASASVPPELVRALAESGYLASFVPEKAGGKGYPMVAHGLLQAALAGGSASVQSLCTVHGMVTLAVLRWGSGELKERFVASLARGDVIGAFALTEPGAGSDVQAIETTAQAEGDSFVLTGKKRWVSFGQIADLFLVFARLEEGPTAFLVPWDAEGLTLRPSPLTLGLRAGMLADLDLQGCRVPRANLVGRPGFGLSHVAASALDLGRYSVAWASLGIAEVAFAAAVKHASERRQRGVVLGDHQLVRRRLADASTLLDAARLLCLRAGVRREAREPGAIADTLTAKYFASRAARQIADHAVQIHGAEGLSEEHPVQRYFRDARVMEIIEGSSEVLEILIAEHALAEHRASAGPEIT